MLKSHPRDCDPLDGFYNMNNRQGEIYGAVSMCRELCLSDSEILERLCKMHHITENEAKVYMQDTVL